MMFSVGLRLRHFRNMGKLFNNKGSIIPESAIVMPLIILLAVAALTLMMEFYHIVIAETENDNEVFANGFEESDRVRKAYVIGDLFGYEE